MHIGAMHSPPAQFVFRVEPVGLETWAKRIALASSIIVAVELHKWLGSQQVSSRRG